MVVLSRTFLALIVLVTIAIGQEVGMTARLDSTTYRIGDIITVRIEARVPDDLRSIEPSVKDSVGPFEIVKIERSGTEPRWMIELMTLDSGRTFIPPMEFMYTRAGDTARKAAFSNPLTIALRGISVDPRGEIKDIKPPVSGPWLFEDVVPYLVALLFIGAAGAAYYYYWRKKKLREAAFVPERPKIPPHREALTALRLVEDKQLWQQGRVKEYYTEITDIVRTFFEKRWGIVALELTSDEILMKMQRIAESEPVWDDMVSLFRTADLVKFAKYAPAPADHLNELKWAYAVVRAMIPAAKTVDEEHQLIEEPADAR